MTQLPWPNKTIRDAFLVDTLETIGRPVSLHYQATVSACYLCSLDPVTNLSTDGFCPVCSGYYWIAIISGITLSAHVVWKSSEELSWYTAGKQMDGDCQIRINYSDSVYTKLKAARFIVVDEREMQVKKINLRGSPEVNRIIVSLLEKENDA